ncbi:PREDICTED: LOC109949935 [Prunus dulcis]|uniref:PREDICTED: LOC109949935 n=1 Tax=Prunus dulcis TaxID=3755 RepID=A0A5E4EER3_PRUDU|nr:PREDICTED: LOC109949935 [Prunus dulcis]
MVSEYNQFAAVGDKRKHDQISSPSHGKEGKKPGDPPTPEKTNLEGRTSNQRRRDETKNKLETGSETDSIKATLVLHEDLKQLSEIIHTIEGNCPNITGSVNVLDLFISSKNHIEYGRKKAGRGVMMLKEGLSILYEAQELLKVTDSKPQK